MAVLDGCVGGLSGLIAGAEITADDDAYFGIQFERGGLRNLRHGHCSCVRDNCSSAAENYTAEPALSSSDSPAVVLPAEMPVLVEVQDLPDLGLLIFVRWPFD